jgi:hypothetical protein
MFTPKKAEKPQIKIKCLLNGISGAGKTYSALLMSKVWAGGDMSKVIFLNTEGERGLMYASKDSEFYGYDYFDIPSPITPENITELISDILAHNLKNPNNAYKCIIIDSISDEWEYILAQSGVASDADKFKIWNVLKPRHAKMLNQIMIADIHIICCCKVKTAYEMKSYTTAKGSSGSKPVKIGLAPIQSDTISYPFFSVLTIDSRGFTCKEEKNNSQIFEYGKSRKIDTQLANEFLDWANAGIEKEDYYINNLDKITQLLNLLELKAPERLVNANEALMNVRYEEEKLLKLINTALDKYADKIVEQEF